MVVKKKRLLEHLKNFWANVWYCSALLMRSAPIVCSSILLSGIIAGVIPGVQVRITKGLIDSMVVRLHTPISTLLQAGVLTPTIIWLISLLGLLLLNNILQNIQPYLGALLKERVGEKLLAQYYGKAVNLPLESFEETHIQDMSERALNGINQFTRYWSNNLQGLLNALFGSFSILFVLGQTNWLIPLVLLIGLIPLVIWNFQATKEFHEMNYIQTTQRRQLTYWRELLTEREAAAEIRLYGLQNHIISGWHTLNGRLMDDLSKLRLRHLWKLNRVGILTYALLGFSLFMLIYAALQHTITAGTFVALLLGIQQFNNFARSLSWRLEYAYRATKEILYVPEFMELAGEALHEDAPPAPPLTYSIEFEHVSFTYPGADKPVLNNLNLYIHPGERIALVGENGAGKSTLAKLLLGLYRPTEGRILIDGIDLHEMRLKDWRDKVGAVFQDFMRYPFSVRENVGLGRLENLDNRSAIEHAAEMSKANEFIEHLPEGYETLLGKEFEGGHDLSYGQWQKLAIARAYLREAALLLLDEPASALDARTEFEVYRQFRDIAEGHTIVLISHRLGSARLADRILFLSNGHVTEEGIHDELIKSGGSYAQLYTMQAEWYQETAESGRNG
jgi:ATP-binding cassette subfamily B protein